MSDLEQEILRLKRELAEALVRPDALVEECERIQSQFQLMDSENAELRAQLLALSASYQRQKEALEEIQTLVGALPFNHTPLSVTIALALAETPDVSLLERIATYIRGGYSVYWSVEALALLDLLGQPKPWADPTLQPDHQK